MKEYILIDGENFVHGVVHVLSSKKLIRYRNSMRRLNMQLLLEEVTHQQTSEIRYYTTRIHTPPTTSDLFRTVENMRRWNAYWVPYIANQGVTFVKAGILKVRSSKRCLNCRHKTEILVEKGVDVRLGVDIVSLASPKTTLYVFSSDSDLIPAVLNARQRGAPVIYVAIEDSINRAMSKSASATITVSHKAIVSAYREANK